MVQYYMPQYWSQNATRNIKLHPSELHLSTKLSLSVAVAVYILTVIAFAVGKKNELPETKYLKSQVALWMIMPT